MKEIDEALLKQLSQWHEKDEFQKIVDTILEIPEDERTLDLTGQLARALNNLGDYETAVEILLSVEDEGKNDPLWHFRLGYAYYYSNMFEQAKAEFEKVLQLTPEDEDARIFLDWCEEELSPTAKTDKLNARLMAAEAIMTGVTFRQRADEFWLWFARHEAKLTEMIDKREEDDHGEGVGFISEGVRLIGEDVNFNMGGDYEFTFTVEGNSYLFYLLPWLVARMPQQYRSKWHFFPYMQSTHGQSFGFRMYDVNIPLEEVMVGLHYEEEQDYFDVRFYHKALDSFTEEQSYNAFYIMMELAIGEGMSRIYINRVDKADAPEEGMFPLTKLESCMTMALEEAQKEVLDRPDERYMVYRMEFDEIRDLRYDMVIGNTCFTELVQDYFNGDTTNFDKLEACGAKAVFLVIPVGDTDRSELLKLRYEIEDRLVTEVLGERGSGQEIGILLGGVAGTDNLYIDLLLYDTPVFMAEVGDLLMQFPYPFYLSEFRPESRLVALAGVEADIPVIPVKPSELAREMMEYIDCPCEWIAPMPDALALDNAYFAALEAGPEEGYFPVLVKVDPLLMNTWKTNAGVAEDEKIAIEKIRNERRGLLEETSWPDGRVYFDKLIAEHEAEWKERGIWGESGEGKPNNDLTSYWNPDTRLTDEILLVRIPVDKPWKIFAWLPWGKSHFCTDTKTLIGITKYWNEVYGAIPAAITGDELEFYLPVPVADEKQANRLAMEYYAFCPLMTDQDKTNDSLGRLANSLQQSTIWYFWCEQTDSESLSLH